MQLDYNSPAFVNSIAYGVKSYLESHPDFLRPALEDMFEDICMSAAISECTDETVPESEITDILNGNYLQ